MIDFLATEPHYLDHLVPIWHELQPHERGRFYITRTMLQHADLRGIERARLGKIPPPDSGPLIVTAAHKDSRRVPLRRVALVEHGAGQTYMLDTGEPDRNPSNPGGTHRDNVSLFLCPNYDVAGRNRAAYPGAAVEVIGCPKLDRWHSDTWWGTTRWQEDPPTVAVAFHWDNHQVPESRWAYPHYSRVLAQIAEEWPGAIGHAHPRAIGRLVPALTKAGLQVAADFVDVLNEADVLVCDNSSVLYEFASTGRPVVVLNAPWYRREVSHGLRFWEAIPGLEVEEPGELGPAITLALEDPAGVAIMRQQAIERVYAYTDGQASRRAADALRAVAGSA